MSKSNRKIVITDSSRHLKHTYSLQLTFWLGTERKGSHGRYLMIAEITTSYAISARCTRYLSVTSTYNTDLHDITEVALNIIALTQINLSLSSSKNINLWECIPHSGNIKASFKGSNMILIRLKTTFRM